MKHTIRFRSFFFILAVTLSLPASASYRVRLRSHPGGTQVIGVQPTTAKTRKGERRLISRLPRFLAEGMKPGPEVFSEYLVDDAALTPAMQRQLMQTMTERGPNLRAANAEVRTLIDQGPKENRINLTIVGDGYTLAEKDRFFADALRTTQGLFTGSTFASYLPLFNVYAVFVPSLESGIGDGRPKNTALGLYRTPKGSKRAIMCAHTDAADRAIAMAPATDYPILLANDEYYGGLGGEYAISTRSVRSGLIVLRHELGHNFGSVGEEYDGGSVYTGANHSSSPNVPWAHWADGGIQVHEAVFLGGEYWWKNLAQGPVEQKFNFPAGNYRLLANVSSVGWATPGDVEVSLDGQLVRLPGPFHDDRAFFDLGPGPLGAGSHRLLYSEKVKDGDNVIAFSNLYAIPATYDFTQNKVGAFLTYSDGGGKAGYRPTHGSCLMRDMMTPNFCVVDKENMWHRFLSKMSLIDGVQVGANARANTVRLQAPKLQGLSIAWFKVEGSKETEVTELRNKAQWEVPAGFTGPMRVKVRFQTPEVRKYADYFAAQRDFQL